MKTWRLVVLLVAATVCVGAASQKPADKVAPPARLQPSWHESVSDVRPIRSMSSQ